ncbi:MAG: hypothetical protein ACPGRD_09485 [Planktomarina sp.]
MDVPPGIWPALIAGSVVAIGWIVNGRRNRREARKLRREKLRDFHRAIYAEIGPNLINLGGDQALDENRWAMEQALVADNTFVPFVPREQNNRIFEALVNDIHILPRTSIDPIVNYYRQLAMITLLADDMRGDKFRTLSPERRMAIYGDYIEMKKQAFYFGRDALLLIRAFSEGGADAAKALEEKLETRLNIQVLGLSDPQSGSV